MPAHSTSTLPEPSTDTTADSSKLSAHLIAERRHAAWVEIADGMLQRCPDPDTFCVHADASIACLDLRHAEHVAIWAAFLGLPAPEVRAHDVPAREDVTTAYRLTTTSTSGRLDGVRWTLTHYHRDPIDPAPAAGSDGD
jgi:hypothetical protein